jgi:Dimethlysulfonioproprionate lyase
LTVADRCGPSFHAVMAGSSWLAPAITGERKLPIPMDSETQRAESLRPLVGALRSLLASAGPEAKPFFRDWPHELIAPQEARTLPVVSALEGLSRYAMPETLSLVEAGAALARDLDWRRTYTSAHFGERFLQHYGWSEWIALAQSLLEQRKRSSAHRGSERKPVSRRASPGGAPEERRPGNDNSKQMLLSECRRPRKEDYA